MAFYDVYALWFSHTCKSVADSRYIHINSVQKFSALFNNSVGKCLFAFILLYFFDLLSLQCQHPLPWSEANWLYQEWKFPGTFVPRSKSSRELLFLGAKVPTGNFRSEEQKYPGAKKSLDTVLPHQLANHSAFHSGNYIFPSSRSCRRLTWSDHAPSLYLTTLHNFTSWC